MKMCSRMADWWGNYFYHTTEGTSGTRSCPCPAHRSPLTIVIQETILLQGIFGLTELIHCRNSVNDSNSSRTCKTARLKVEVHKWDLQEMFTGRAQLLYKFFLTFYITKGRVLKKELMRILFSIEYKKDNWEEKYFFLYIFYFITNQYNIKLGKNRT